MTRMPAAGQYFEKIVCSNPLCPNFNPILDIFAPFLGSKRPKKGYIKEAKGGLPLKGVILEAMMWTTFYKSSKG